MGTKHIRVNENSLGTCISNFLFFFYVNLFLFLLFYFIFIISFIKFLLFFFFLKVNKVFFILVIIFILFNKNSLGTCISNFLFFFFFQIEATELACLFGARLHLH